MNVSVPQKRSNRLLFKKMLEYFFPTMAALSLNEFVDSMIVPNLLGNGGAALQQQRRTDCHGGLIPPFDSPYKLNSTPIKRG